MKHLSRALIMLIGWPFVVCADEPMKKAQGIPVPFRRTETQHILVRAKINGMGPYNFIVDTGAPVMFVSVPVGKKLGLRTDNGWAILEQLDVEGGVTMNKVRCRVETPFQLEGMNGMGLAGAELHGIIGYTILAKFRLEIDFSRDRMTWTPLNFEPPPPLGIGGKGGQGGLEFLGAAMKFVGMFAGAKKPPEPAPRGFLGIELAEKEQVVSIVKVLEKSPAHAAGLKSGDQLLEVNGQVVKSGEDVHRRAAQATAGATLQLVVRRGQERLEIRAVTGDGL